MIRGTSVAASGEAGKLIASENSGTMLSTPLRVMQRQYELRQPQNDSLRHEIKVDSARAERSRRTQIHEGMTQYSFAWTAAFGKRIESLPSIEEYSD
jgi:hypothetical protein